MTWQEQFKNARLATGMSQAKLASTLEIPRRSIENWEYGVNEPPVWVQTLLLEKLETIKPE
jgi:DNA-binding transcriptional regulator YiaG